MVVWQGLRGLQCAETAVSDFAFWSIDSFDWLPYCQLHADLEAVSNFVADGGLEVSVVSSKTYRGSLSHPHFYRRRARI